MLHWWLRPKDEQRRIRRWALEDLRRRAEEDVQRRLEASRQEEAQRARQRQLEEATRCGLCKGTGRAYALVRGSRPPTYEPVVCPCSLEPTQDATPAGQAPVQSGGATA